MKRVTSRCLIMLVVLSVGCATGAKQPAANTPLKGQPSILSMTREAGQGETSRYGTNLTIVYFGEKEWVVYTDLGYYDCTPGAEKYFHFVQGMEVAPVDEYRDTYHVPGLREMFMTGRAGDPVS